MIEIKHLFQIMGQNPAACPKIIKIKHGFDDSSKCIILKKSSICFQNHQNQASSSNSSKSSIFFKIIIFQQHAPKSSKSIFFKMHQNPACCPKIIKIKHLLQNHKRCLHFDDFQNHQNDFEHQDFHDFEEIMKRRLILMILQHAQF